jgi:hypothetical protein
MSRRLLPGLLLAAFAAAVPPAHAQAPAAASPEPYTFVAEWQIPRNLWAAFPADFVKNTRPILEKLAGDGTLVGWGVYEEIVHTPDGYTHGAWWTSTTIAGVEKARRALLAASASSPSLAGATGHRDFFLRAIINGGKPFAGEGYLTVSSYLLKPGKGREWKELWEKHDKPLFDDLVAKGTLLAYSVEVEDLHTDNPLRRSVVTLTPNAEADDQFVAAADAAGAKLTPQERQTRALTFEALVEPAAHRDSYARIIRAWQK